MGDTLRTYLKVQNLYVRDINRGASYAAVMAYLEKLGGPHCKVVLPADHNNTANHIGQAYLNFNTHDESKACLDKYRFSIKFKDQPAKMMYAAVDKDRVYGPFSLKFQIIVKNLSEEVDVKTLFEFFSKFGEIYQCKTDTDNFKQYFGQVTYLDEESVSEAVTRANQTRWHSTVILVEPHHRAHMAAAAAAAGPSQAQAPPPPPPPPAAARSSSSDVPITSTAAAAAPAGSSSGGGLRVIQLPRQQQQQQPGTPASVGSSSSSGQQQQQQQQNQAAQPPAVTSLQQQHLQMQQQQLNLFATSPRVTGPPPPPPAAAAVTAADIPIAAPFSVTAAAVGPSSSSSSNGAAAVGDPVHVKFSGLNLGVSITGPPAAAAANGSSSSSHHVRSLPPGYAHNLRDLHRTSAAAAAGSSSSDPGAGFTNRTAAAAAALHSSSSRRLATAAAADLSISSKSASGGLLQRLVTSISDISEMLTCPITHEVFVEPVVAADGVTYEHDAILHWLTNHDRSPMTNEPMTNMTLYPNKLVKSLIEELL